jgi:DNA integrity scanning protein DisA with diadenylate cyclase activity
MASYYNQGVKVPVWIVTDLPENEATALEDALHQDGAVVMEWPSHSFMTTVHEMGKQGWRHVTGKEKPFTVDVNFVSVAAAKHVKTLFGPQAMMTGSHARPYQQALNRKIETEDDYRRIFDEVLALEGETELSNIFQMASRRSAVYISRAPVPSAVVSKLCQNVLTVGEQNCRVSSKGMSVEDLVEAVRTEVDNLLNLA